LTKEQLEEQMIELYEKFSPVKVYYNFVFNPNEDKILQSTKLRSPMNISRYKQVKQNEEPR
jgi:hypothetical protein